MNKYVIVLTALLLVGCQDRYRYPCQDPNNMNSPECAAEVCKLTKECPEYGK